MNETSEYAEPLSCTIPISDCVLTYPLRSTSKYLAEAEPIPEIIWTTLGSENGLGGHIYYFTGTVKRYLDEDESGGYTYFVVDTDEGEVLVGDVYRAAEELAIKQGQMDIFNQFFVEENGDYSLPPVGETARFICTYSGFSLKQNMPAFGFGANEMLVEAERGG